MMLDDELVVFSYKHIFKHSSLKQSLGRLVWNTRVYKHTEFQINWFSSVQSAALDRSVITPVTTPVAKERCVIPDQPASGCSAGCETEKETATVELFKIKHVWFVGNSNIYQTLGY